MFVWKDENKRKWGRGWPIFKKLLSFFLFRLSFSLTLTGDLQLCVNNRCIGAHLTDLPVSSHMWLILDIYGSTQAVRDQCYKTFLLWLMPMRSFENLSFNWSNTNVLDLNVPNGFNVHSKKVESFGLRFCREDNIPAEILARGPDALEAYQKLRRAGSAPLYRGRVFLVGLDRCDID